MAGPAPPISKRQRTSPSPMRQDGRGNNAHDTTRATVTHPHASGGMKWSGGTSGGDSAPRSPLSALNLNIAAFGGGSGPSGAGGGKRLHSHPTHGGGPTRVGREECAGLVPVPCPPAARMAAAVGASAGSGVIRQLSAVITPTPGVGSHLSRGRGGGAGAAGGNLQLCAITPAPSFLPHLGMSATVPMDADGGDDDDDDMDFGGQESFPEWLARVGLEGPDDGVDDGAMTTAAAAAGCGGAARTTITAEQREELEALWAGAAEADTLRKLVENLKDSELEMARSEQVANEGWAADFEAATATAWRGKVEAASAAEVAARSALEAKQAEVSAAADAASRERCQAAAAAVESGALRGRLQEAMMAAESSEQRATTLEGELQRTGETATGAARDLHAARRAHAAAVAKAEASLAKVETAEAAAALEREAYETSRDEAVARERRQHAAQLAAARDGAEQARVEAAQRVEASRVEACAARSDGADGRAALKQALALREAEVEHSRMSAGEAARACVTLENKVVALEVRLHELKTAATAKVEDLERQLADTTRATTALRATEVRAAGLEVQLVEARAATEAATDASSATAAAGEARVAALEAHLVGARAATDAAKAEAATATAYATEKLATAASGRSTAALEAALARATDAHGAATIRAEAAEAHARRLDHELGVTKVNAATAAANVARQIQAVRAATHHPTAVAFLQPPSGDTLTVQQRLGTELAKVAGQNERLEAEVLTLRAAAAAAEVHFLPSRAPPATATRAGVTTAEAKTAATGAGTSDEAVLSAVIAKRVELAALERKVEAATERLQRVAAAAAAGAAIGAGGGGDFDCQSEWGSEGQSGGVYEWVPTPRTRARTSHRLTHGYPNPAVLGGAVRGDEASAAAQNSPNTELRRRATAMGMRASPFAPKRKRKDQDL